jgi:hypothetical protein
VRSGVDRTLPFVPGKVHRQSVYTLYRRVKPSPT